MAVFKNMHGAFRGAVGNLVGSTWKGISVLRQKPENVSNPNTLKQQEQRLKFKLMSEFLREVEPFLQIGFKQRAKGKTVHNAAMSQNMTDGFQGVFPEITLSYADLVLADGSLKSEKTLEVTNSIEGTLSITWTHNLSRTRQNGSDQLMILVYNATQKESFFVLDGTRRDAESLSLELLDEEVGDELHVWISFINEEETKSSRSTYFGPIVFM